MNPRTFCRESTYPIAVLLTFDFDPLFFERLVLPDLWAGGAGDVLVIADSNRIDESRTRWEGQVRYLGRRYILERAHVAGAFHPKMILRLNTEGALVWVGSGNLTSGGWGGNGELASAWKVGPDQRDKGDWLQQVLDGCESWCSGLRQLDILRRARELPWLESEGPATEPAPILVSRDHSSLSKLLAERWRGRRFEDVKVLTGSTDARGAQLRWCHETLGVSRATVLVDEHRCSFLGAEITKLPLVVDTFGDSTSGTLHAKLFWFDGPEGSAAVHGSANCSAAAWLVPPSQGGNTEVVAVFDTVLAGDFSEVGKYFSKNELEPLALPRVREVSIASSSQEESIGVSEVAWERTTGEIHVSFLLPLPAATTVELRAAGSWIVCDQDGAQTWVAEVQDVDASAGSQFVDIRVHIGPEEVVQTSHWVNDLAELRHAARGRRIAEALSDLGKRRSRTERQRLLAELHRIGIALISDPSAFPDPLVRDSARVRPDPIENKADPIDPDDLIVSLKEIPNDTTPHGTSSRPGISLLGVVRALFELETAENEVNVQDSVEQHGKQRDQPPSIEPQDPPQVSEREKAKLRQQMLRFLDEFRASKFARSCTATQLQQAAAYPLAVVFQGRRGNWIEPADTGAWVREVFDTLFTKELPGKHRGLIAAVADRYKGENRRLDFERIVGDGTLWVAFLHALTAFPRTARRERFERALAIRRVYQSRELLATTDAGRMRSLLSALERRHDQVAFLTEAPRLSCSLNALEGTLRKNWKDLVDRQKRQQIRHEVDDFLWHPKAGWGIALSSVKAVPGSKIDAYLQLRAREAKVVGVGFYVNVSKAAEAEAALHQQLLPLLQQERSN